MNGQSDNIVIRASSIAKLYGEVVAVDGVSFEVRRGETYGLLGPNGAGKTTTMRLMSGLSPLTGGELTVAGIDVSRQAREVRNVLGVVTQQDGLDTDLNARDNLIVYGFIAGLSHTLAEQRADAVLMYFDLTDKGKEALRRKQRAKPLRQELLGWRVESVAEDIIDADPAIVEQQPDLLGPQIEESGGIARHSPQDAPRTIRCRAPDADAQAALPDAQRNAVGTRQVVVVAGAAGDVPVAGDHRIIEQQSAQFRGVPVEVDEMFRSYALSGFGAGDVIGPNRRRKQKHCESRANPAN